MFLPKFAINFFLILMLLSELHKGDKAIIVKVRGRGAFRKRITEMGFIKGKIVEVLLNAPLRDPIEYKIMDYEVSLRKNEADLIEVVAMSEMKINSNDDDNNFSKRHSLTDPTEKLRKVAIARSKTINVALVGNPNSGKTSLFNIASGSHEHVGNYSGVTVDAKEGVFKYNGYTFRIVDLPGTYSLTAYSPEELYVRKHIMDENPDVIINVVSASNLERNLYLTTQLIDMDATFIVALNMYDELEKSGAGFDYELLSKMIGIPMIPTVSKTGKGINELFDNAISVYEGNNPVTRHIKIDYGETLENGIKAIKKTIKEEDILDRYISSRYVSIKLLEKDKEIEKYLRKSPHSDQVFEARDNEIKKIESLLNEDTETAITDARYGFIDGALKETYKEGKANILKITHAIDTLVTHKFWGYPIFLLFIFLMFEGTFLLGDYPMQFIEWIIGIFSDFIGNNMSEGPFKDLIVNGIIGGVGSVIVFLPNIVILYLFISFMEDSGYMARAAFIMDKFMHKMGLHGKSFIPLVMGFGCNVPAIMGARTIESRNARLITILINPLMSCSARLPVYLLFAGAFFGKHGGSIIFLLYITGIILAVLMARLFKRFLIKGEDIPFVMELPPYRMPTGKAIFRHMWDKASQYLKKMGGIILIASIIIWFLEYFPQNNDIKEQYAKKILSIENQYKTQSEKEIKEKNFLITEVKKQEQIELQKNSFIGKLGRLTEPIVEPLGFDWKMSVSLLSGMAAKEIVVSTMGILYNGNSENETALEKSLLAEKKLDGTPVFTPLVVISFLLFVLIYFPCVATIAAIKNESGSWKWALFVIVYTTSLAWIVSFLVYQIGSLIIN